MLKLSNTESSKEFQHYLLLSRGDKVKKTKQVCIAKFLKYIFIYQQILKWTNLENPWV